MSEAMVWFSGATFALGMLAGGGGFMMWRASLRHLEEARKECEAACRWYQGLGDRQQASEEKK